MRRVWSQIHARTDRAATTDGCLHPSSFGPPARTNQLPPTWSCCARKEVVHPPGSLSSCKSETYPAHR